MNVFVLVGHQSFDQEDTLIRGDVLDRLGPERRFQCILAIVHHLIISLDLERDQHISRIGSHRDDASF